MGRQRQFSSTRSFLPAAPTPGPVGGFRPQKECGTVADNCEVPSRFLATEEHHKPHLWEVLRVSPATDGSRWHFSMGVVAEKS